MDAALIDEEVRDALGGPGELGEARVNLLVQEADAFLEQSSLLLR